jgi:ATPase subunit of ABC transporter with duplicated ATPase domains
MIILHDVTYTHPNRDVVFSGINLTINKQDKIALIGNNGAGKSTLLRLIAGYITPSSGTIKTHFQPYYVPQHFGQFNSLTVAQALGVENKLNALVQILNGDVTDENLELLDDDWEIEKRCKEALSHWKLDEADLARKMETLSGGQKTKIFLAGILIHKPALHRGKVLLRANGINFGYNDSLLWDKALDFQVISGERIVIKGVNGSGKTTLIKIILGQLEPSSGTIDRSVVKSLYIDQDYSLIDDTLSVYEQAQQFNTGALEEHDVRMRLNRFLFTRDYWDNPCKALSGGEKMRLMLCSLTLYNQAPDIIVLDEPTNNLDIQNIEILTAAVNEYQGTLLIISHDDYFLQQISVEKVIDLV